MNLGVFVRLREPPACAGICANGLPSTPRNTRPGHSGTRMPSKSAPNDSPSDAPPVFTYDDREIALRCAGASTPSSESFTFARVLGPTASNADVYTAVLDQSAAGVLRGVNRTIIAYGQTASGKTHTMSGSDTDPGIISRAIEALLAARSSEQANECEVCISAYHVYNDQPFDLLAAPDAEPCKVRLDKDKSCFHLEGLIEVLLCSSEDVRTQLVAIESARRTCVTSMNDRSSRAHTVVRVLVSARAAECQGRACDDGAPLRAELSLVDLAGSERLSNADSASLGERKGSAAHTCRIATARSRCSSRRRWAAMRARHSSARSRCIRSTCTRVCPPSALRAPVPKCGHVRRWPGTTARLAMRPRSCARRSRGCTRRMRASKVASRSPRSWTRPTPLRARC